MSRLEAVAVEEGGRRPATPVVRLTTPADPVLELEAARLRAEALDRLSRALEEGPVQPEGLAETALLALSNTLTVDWLGLARPGERGLEILAERGLAGVAFAALGAPARGALERLEPVYLERHALVPLAAAGRAVGLLGAGRLSPSGWTPSDRALLESAARVIGHALERARGRAELEARERALSAFVDLTRAARTGGDPAAVAEGALAVLRRAVDFSHAGLYALRGERWCCVALHGEASPAYRAAAEAGWPGQGVLARAQRGGPLFLDAESEPPEPLWLGVASAALCPVAALGPAVLVVSYASPRRWSDLERSVLGAAAESLGIAYERAERAHLLERKTAEMEAFVYGVSHDLKAPMVSLGGMTALLTEALAAGDTAEAGFFVERVRANVARMSRLVTDLLELSRVGRVDEDEGALDVGAVVAGVAGELEGALAARGVRLELPRRWPIVTYPATRLYQVFSNLIGNAVKFMPASTSDPLVRLSWRLEHGALEVRVTDNGAGILEPYRRKVFELFARLDPSVEGTGVGLTMVRRIVEDHGGQVWLEDAPSAPGLVAAFSVPASRVVLDTPSGGVLD